MAQDEGLIFPDVPPPTSNLKHLVTITKLLTINKTAYNVLHELNVYIRDIFMKSQTVSARLDPETAKKLDQLVKATARSRSYLVAEAIKTYVEDQAWQIEAIEEGIKEADKGKFATDKEVRKTFKKWGLNEG